MFAIKFNYAYREHIPKVSICIPSDDQNPNFNSGGSSITLSPTKCNGMVHLFREFPEGSVPHVIRNSGRKAQLFVVAVPNYFHGYDFLQFCGSHLNDFRDIMFIWNDESQDTYSVLITLKTKACTERFYSAFNGKRFKPDGDERCHIYIIEGFSFMQCFEYAAKPAEGFMALPTCPVCLERLDQQISGIQDQDTSGIHGTICGNSFDSWNILSCQVCQIIRQQQYDDSLSCHACGISKNLSICFICGFVNCERCEKEPGEKHRNAKHHRLTLDLKTQKIWDSVTGKFLHRISHSNPGFHGALSSSDVEARDESMCFEPRNSGEESSIFKAVKKAMSSNTHDMNCQMGSVTKEKNGEEPEPKKRDESMCIEARNSGEESSISKAAKKAMSSKRDESMCIEARNSGEKSSISKAAKKAMSSKARDVAFIDGVDKCYFLGLTTEGRAVVEIDGEMTCVSAERVQVWRVKSPV